MKTSSNLFWRILQFPVTRIVLGIFVVLVAVALVQTGMIVLGAALGVRGAPVWQLVSAILTVITAYVVYWLFVRLIEKRPLTELAFQGMPRELGVGILYGAVL